MTRVNTPAVWVALALATAPLVALASAMGRSAKATRGGNKLRVNVGRQKAKLEVRGVKDQTALALATAAAAAARKHSSAKVAIAGSLRAIQRQREEQQAATAVKMAPRPPVGSGAALAANRAAAAQQLRKTAKASRGAERPSSVGKKVKNR